MAVAEEGEEIEGSVGFAPGQELEPAVGGGDGGEVA